MVPVSIVLTQAMASSAPAPPMEWPIIDLVELNRHVVGLFAKDRLDRQRFGEIIQAALKCRAR